jgi:hypothetical protein
MSLEVMQQGPSTVTLSGPLWTALYTMADIQEMIEMANLRPGLCSLKS